MTPKPVTEHKVWRTYVEIQTAFEVAKRIGKGNVDLSLAANYFTATSNLVGAMAEIITDLQARVAALEAR